MPEDIKVCVETGVIYIKSQGNIKEADLRQSLDTMLAISQEKAYCRVLVDAREQISLPPLFFLHVFAGQLAQRFPHFKHALVVSHESTKNLYFIDTILNNRGVNIKTFNSMELALSWLTK